MRVTRHPIAARAHVQIDLEGAQELPRANLRDAIVKLTVKVAQGTPVDVAALRRQVLEAGAVHVAPVVPSYTRRAVQVVVACGTRDFDSAIKAWAAQHPPPEGCDPAALLAEIS